VASHKRVKLVEEANRIRASIAELVLQMVRGLGILEDGRYVTWPDPLDPGKNAGVVVVERSLTLRNFANEFAERPPQSALRVVEENVVPQYEALWRGLSALADVYQTMVQQGARRIRREPDHSILGIASLNAWRVMLLNPLNSTPLGQQFAALQTSGLVAAWLPAPVLTGPPATLADL